MEMTLEQKLLNNKKLYNLLINPDDDSFKYFAMHTKGNEYLLFPYKYAFPKDREEVHYN